MSVKSLSNSLKRFQGTYTSIRYSDYFEGDVINTTIEDQQFDIFIYTQCNNGSLLVKIVTLGVKYQVSKLKAFKGYTELNQYLKTI